MLRVQELVNCRICCRLYKTKQVPGWRHALSGQICTNSLSCSAMASAEAIQSVDTQHRSPLEDFLQRGSRLTKGAHLLWQQIVRPGDFVIDATCGNGGDTIWLSRAVGISGRVLAIDLQAEAVQATQERVASQLPPDLAKIVECVQACHSQEDLWRGTPTLVCFNLGYLPGADKGLITTPASTVQAIQCALRILKPGGLLSVMTYTAHKGGLDEHEAVMSLLGGLPSESWTVISNNIINRPTSPVLTIAARR